MQQDYNSRRKKYQENTMKSQNIKLLTIATITLVGLSAICSWGGIQSFGGSGDGSMLAGCALIFFSLISLSAWGELVAVTIRENAKQP